jgi:hypothetical protein
MEAVRFSEKWVIIYQSVRCNIPVDFNFHERLENLKEAAEQTRHYSWLYTQFLNAYI